MNGIQYRTYIALLVFLLTSLHAASVCQAEVLDKVVASIDNEAITLSEFQAEVAASEEAGLKRSRAEVLNTMINKFLLLREAKRLRIEAPDEDSMVNEYVNLKLRAMITVREDSARKFYNENRKEFNGKGFLEVRDMIETLLREREVNARLKNHIEELRSKSYIRVLVE